MPIDGGDKRQAAVNFMIEEFRAAQKRRLVQRGILLWNRTEAAHCVKALVDTRHAKAEGPSSDDD